MEPIAWTINHHPVGRCSHKSTTMVSGRSLVRWREVDVRNATGSRRAKPKLNSQDGNNGQPALCDTIHLVDCCRGLGVDRFLSIPTPIEPTRSSVADTRYDGSYQYASRGQDSPSHRTHYAGRYIPLSDDPALRRRGCSADGRF